MHLTPSLHLTTLRTRDRRSGAALPVKPSSSHLSSDAYSAHAKLKPALDPKGHTACWRSQPSAPDSIHGKREGESESDSDATRDDNPVGSPPSNSSGADNHNHHHHHTTAWLARKALDMADVTGLLNESVAANQFSNGGPCVTKLEREARGLLSVSEDRTVIATCNGSAALHALVSAWDMKLGRRLRYATQAYTIPTSAQGPFAERGRIHIVDVDESGALDLTEVDKLCASEREQGRPEIDGVIVTNVLGNAADMMRYESWARARGKILLLDNAATGLTSYGGTSLMNLGDGAIVSLHHTKPLGFGEGGLVVAHKSLEPYLRKACNFGYDMIKMDQLWLSEGDNRKMADVAAAFCLSFLRLNLSAIVKRHRQIYERWQALFADAAAGGSVRRMPHLFPNFSDGTPVVSCVAVVMPGSVTVADFEGECVRKYYKPLENDRERAPVSWDIYDRVICFPCNVDMDDRDVERMFARVMKVAEGQQM